MATTRMLWRLEGVALETQRHPDRLTDGLRLHLAHTDLTMVLMQIGNRQQAYVVLTGCAGCVYGRCEPGCYVDLLRRLLQDSFTSCDLRYVKDGLAQRPYERVILIAPSKDARPLDGGLLQLWPEARLVLHWRAQSRQTLSVAGLLAVGTGDPDPGPQLAAWGWAPLRAPSLVSQRLIRAPIPAALPFGRVWPHAPALLLPCVAPATIPALPIPTTLRTPANDPMPILTRPPAALGQVFPLPGRSSHEMIGHTVSQSVTSGDHLQMETAHTAPAVTPEEDAVLAQWLLAALSGVQRVTAAAPASPQEATDAKETASPWPVGPCGLRPHAVGELLARIVAAPAFTSSKQASQIGITHGRLARLEGVSEDLAAALIVWFDHAGVLADPFKAEQRWRTPRPLMTTDLAQLAAKLRATPLPSRDAIRMAYGGHP